MACIAPQGASWPLAALELRFQKVPGCPSDFCLLLISPARLWAFCCFTVCVNRPQIPELSPPPWTPSSLPANSGWGGRGHLVRVHACPPHPEALCRRDARAEEGERDPREVGRSVHAHLRPVALFLSPVPCPCLLAHALPTASSAPTVSFLTRSQPPKPGLSFY